LRIQVNGNKDNDYVAALNGCQPKRARKQYRAIVRDGVAGRPWQQLKGQIYLGSDGFIEKHAAPKDLKEIPRVQLRAAKPPLDRILAKREDRV
jgi:putative transposase